MNELILAGNKYISSKRASKLTGYTTDYIGQMCRGDKMDCRLVGRNWYVNDESIIAQRKSFKKEQLNEDRQAIEYKKLEPMYYSDDERNNDPDVSKVVEVATEEEYEEVTEVEENAIEIKERKENLIPILNMIESPMVDLRSAKRELIKKPVREVVKRKVLLPQKSFIRLPVAKAMISLVVLIGTLFAVSTFVVQQTMHYTYSDSVITTEFQLANIGSFLDL